MQPNLLILLVRFLPESDYRVRATFDRTAAELASDGLVRRYLRPDGLPGDEGAFVICSFWVVDNLALRGDIERARELFERLCGFANDVASQPNRSIQGLASSWATSRRRSVTSGSPRQRSTSRRPVPAQDEPRASSRPRSGGHATLNNRAPGSCKCRSRTMSDCQARRAGGPFRVVRGTNGHRYRAALHDSGGWERRSSSGPGARSQPPFRACPCSTGSS